MPQLVKRQKASLYMLWVVVSFAFTVLFTRVYLAITGYPQIGSGVFHIAHVLWGGIVLAIGALLPLIFSNARIRSVSAIMTGVGFGLFIDEIGKFITANNDYFFRPAAPIIYVFFLLTVIILYYIQKPRKKTDKELFYYVLDDCKEILEGDLDKYEKEQIKLRLNTIIETTKSPNVKEFAQALDTYIEKAKLDKEKYKLPWYIKFRQNVKNEMFKYKKTQSVLFTILISLLTLRAISAFFQLIFAWIYIIAGDGIAINIVNYFIELGVIDSPFDITLLLAQTMAEGIVGIMILYWVYGYVFKKKTGTKLLKIALIFSLCTVDVLGFYFDQFGHTISVLIDVAIISYISLYEELYNDRED